MNKFRDAGRVLIKIIIIGIDATSTNEAILKRIAAAGGASADYYSATTANLDSIF